MENAARTATSVLQLQGLGLKLPADISNCYSSKQIYQILWLLHSKSHNPMPIEHILHVVRDAEPLRKDIRMEYPQGVVKPVHAIVLL